MSPTVKAIIPHFAFSSVLFSQVRGKWQWVHFRPLWRPAHNLGKGMVGLAKSRFLNYFLFSLSLKSQDSTPLHLVSFENQSLLSHLLWTKCFCSPGFKLLKPVSQGDANGRWGLREVTRSGSQSPHNGISALLIREAPER